MKDRVPLYPGRVKLTPVSGQENTYDMVRADEPTQEGDPLSKATFLKDDTAALFGLDATAVPDDALALLSRFHKGLGNEYVWEKFENTNIYVPVTVEGTSPLVIVTDKYSSFSDSPPGSVIQKYTDLLYYNTLSVNQNTGELLLSNQFTPTSRPDTSTQSYWARLIPFYVKTPSGNVLKVKSVKNAYNDYIHFNYEWVSNTEVVQSATSVGYVNSPDPNAYPPAVSDGYTYTALGQLGNKTKVELFSYVGTNTYGENNPTILTFDFKPKFLWFVGKQPVSGGEPFSPAIPSGNFYPWIATENTPTTRTSRVGFGNPNNIQGWMSADGKTLTWFNYSTSNASDQLNSSNARYYYIAIG